MTTTASATTASEKILGWLKDGAHGKARAVASGFLASAVGLSPATVRRVLGELLQSKSIRGEWRPLSGCKVYWYE